MQVIPYLVDEGPPSDTTATYLITITKGVIMISPAAWYWNNITTGERTSNEPIPRRLSQRESTSRFDVVNMAFAWHCQPEWRPSLAIAMPAGAVVPRPESSQSVCVLTRNVWS